MQREGESAIGASTQNAIMGLQQANWRVFAVRYAHRESALRCEHFYGRVASDQEPMPIDYFVWLLVSSTGRAILVDGGFTALEARLRDREYLAPPLHTINQLGIDEGDISDMILSHLHYDHTGLIGSLSNTQIHVQESEIAFWVGPAAHKSEYSRLANADDIARLVKLNLAGNVAIHKGDASLCDAVHLYHVGGHTPGSQVVHVSLGGGKVVVLASDASHFYENLESDLPDAIIHCLSDVYAGFQRIRQLTGSEGVFVPGHDPKVLDRFQPPSEDLRGLVVEVL